MDPGAEVVDVGHGLELLGRGGRIRAGRVAQDVGAGLSVGPGAQAQGGAARSLRGEGAAPDTRLDDLAVDAHPLHVGVRREEGAVGPRGHLDAERLDPLTQGQDTAQCGGPLLGVGDAAASRTTGRVGEDGVDALGGEVELHGVGAAHLGVREGHEVDGSQGGRGLVPLEGEDRKAQTGQGHRVAADPAAQVGDAVRCRGGEAGGVVGRDGEARGLLEAVGGEEHPLGEGTELRAGASAQPLLGEGGGDERRVVALRAQALAEGQGLGLLVGRQEGEQRPPLGREERRKPCHLGRALGGTWVVPAAARRGA